MSRTLPLRLAISLLWAFSLLSASWGQQAALGDLDHDGVATVRDIAVIAGHFNGTAILSETQKQYADVNKDGAINDADMDELVKEILGTRTPQALPLSSVRFTSPSSGEGDVAVTRETVVHFTVPLSLSASLDTTKFKAEFGGKKILSRVELSSDRRKATLFYLEPLPSNARIRVDLDSTGLTDLLNRPVDGDSDGQPGGIHRFSFDTLSVTPVATTAIVGRVIASERATGGLETPLAGVTVTVDGAEQTLRAVTDAQGNFMLSPCPAGTFFVKIDGRTSPASSWPGGDYYPEVGKKWHALAGRTDNLAGDLTDTERGTIYLPLIRDNTLKPVSATQETVIQFPADVLAANPALAGTEIHVPANSLFSDAGVRGGSVGIAPVAPDRLPSPLPPGLNPPLVITIQTNGATNFDRPVPVSFPNLPDPATGERLEPGAKSALWSFDHDTGQWEIAGPMTVSENGLWVRSDPGTGVRQPGWHAPNQGANPGSPGAPGQPDCPRDCHAYAVEKCLEHNFAAISGLYQYTHNKCTDDIRKECEECLARANRGPRDINEILPLVEDLNSKLSVINELAYPFAVRGMPLDQATTSAIHGLEQELNDLAGGNYRELLRVFRLELESKLSANYLGPSNIGKASINYAAIVESGGSVYVLRGKTNSDGSYRLIVPSIDSLKQIYFFDLSSRRWGSSLPFLRTDLPFRLPPIYLVSANSGDQRDFDGDGLIDIAEVVLGTNLTSPDSDQDGITDGAEVEQGMDPLSGLNTSVGVLASTPSSAPAIHVSASNNIAAVAMGEGGVGVYNVFSGLNPTRILDLDTPGFASSVASAGDYVCVADEQAGLAIIDVGDPGNIRLARQIAFGASASAVATDGVTAYVGTGDGKIIAVDLASGLILSRVVTGGGVAQDMAIAGEQLYLLDWTSLRIFNIADGTPSLAGTINLPLVAGGMSLKLRLFCDGKTAYCAHSRGYAIVNVENPAGPQLVSSFTDGRFGWKQMIGNGSGLGVAVVSPNGSPDGPHNVDLYNVGPDGRLSNFITTIETPGLALAASLYNGFAYVADREAGLQVINYLAFDSQGQSPSITLSSNFNLAGGVAEEGKRMRLSAAVADDVQVRNVEFYLNGQLTETDGNYPFESAFLTPAMSEGDGTFTVRAKATDTGGNFTWTDEITLTLTPDATRPLIAAHLPGSNQLVGAITEAWVKFNEPMSATSLAAGLSVNGASGATVGYRESTNTAFISFAAPLSPGNYQLQVTTSVQDAAGNPLAAPLSVPFRVFALTDNDADGLADDWESLLGLSTSAADSDGNGILDGDEDSDGDGLANGLEILAGMNPTSPDTDGDGLPDGLEDSDLDGLSDGRELVLGTNRFHPDTDEDTWTDEAEVSAGSDPLNPRSRPYPFLKQSLELTSLHIGRAGEGLLTTVASRPPLTAIKIGSMAASGGFIRATPDVTAVRMGGGESQLALGSSLMAKPQVTALRLGTAFGTPGDSGGSYGSLLAKPPVKVIRPLDGWLADPESKILATPPLRVQREP